jgi:RNA polymerase sigma-70 factor (ECF subfamily)
VETRISRLDVAPELLGGITGHEDADVREREARDRLATIYDDCAPRVYAYAVRHCGPVDADDVVAETFAVAWRRIEAVPDPAIGWLLVTARNVIAGRRRTERKQVDLARFGAAVPTSDEPAAEEVAVRRQVVLEALATLSEREREALLLTAWDGLDHAAAAAVAGCSPRAFRARLMRARARLTAALAPQSSAEIRLPERNCT